MLGYGIGDGPNHLKICGTWRKMWGNMSTLTTILSPISAIKMGILAYTDWWKSIQEKCEKDFWGAFLENLNIYG